MDIIKEINNIQTQFVQQLETIRNVYATTLYYNESNNPSSIIFGRSEDGSLYSEVDSYKCSILKASGDKYYGTVRNLLLVSLLTIFETFCDSLLQIANDYRTTQGMDIISDKKLDNYLRGNLKIRWENIFKAFDVDFSSIPTSHQNDLKLLDKYRIYRNQIVHENGKITEEFKTKVLAISNHAKELAQLDNTVSDSFYISSYNFSEGIYLFELTTKSMIRSILENLIS
ncbi:hypothetical protein [Ruminococcus albus]|uniref:RiboL-PSP-HEPN domain-containing protein n=1 Tax=Ruminococcus albus TaxID=1264 RepID=A0A1I1QW69_RUMAL|nr:hypothetical protein [Ruminococcus albus]SFD24118.1 hypothetical protein SAMN02910406_03470 [Ruminococcus albus]